MEQWNRDQEKALGEDGGVPPKLVSLRQTGYMTVGVFFLGGARCTRKRGAC
jgi:hypothetical protein